ncbi:hypothetical protein [Desulfonatronovibrio magnus]|uniref:hypothetical protein n=1 Tax=Desulfonatronovibrio magnus TaxID=698827 RepID=UPI0005EB8CFE|nr:hypothetical protein [Desulfonatronovibrio magnus]
MHVIKSILIILCLLTLWACEKRIMPEPEAPEAPLMRQAASYWDSRDYAMSRSLYKELSQIPDLPRRQKNIILRRLATSSYYLEDYESAVNQLEEWSRIDPSAVRLWSWHEMYADSLKKVVGEQRYYQYFSELIRDRLLPAEIRTQAVMELTRIDFARHNFQNAALNLQTLYAQLETFQSRASLENKFISYLVSLPASKLNQAAQALIPMDQTDFPWSVFAWHYHALVLEQTPGMWNDLLPKFQALIKRGQFADPSPYQNQLQAWMDKFGVPAREIALLLPLSGNFSSAGWKIMRGAGLAHWQSLSDSNPIKIRFINTDEEGWLEKLQNMNSVSMVGGPVSRAHWDDIQRAGLNSDKTFFTFLPDINDEGRSGWRFFTSHRDQIRSLLMKTTSGLNFTNFALFYPEEEFGRAYARIFLEEAERLGVTVSNVSSYPADDPQRWNRIVASLLDITNFSSPYLQPSPDFQAVFIPDSLSRAKGMLPQFFYHDQNQLVFMGPMLWSESHSPGFTEHQYFSLSMSPGPWDAQSSKTASIDLIHGMEENLQDEPDFWVALGYDFINFAMHTGELPAPSQYYNINQTLHSSTFNHWSMAPITWDMEGNASQDLYIFQLERNALSRVDLDYFDSLIQIREQRKIHWRDELWQRRQSQENN